MKSNELNVYAKEIGLRTALLSVRFRSIGLHTPCTTQARAFEASSHAFKINALRSSDCLQQDKIECEHNYLFSLSILWRVLDKKDGNL